MRSVLVPILVCSLAGIAWPGPLPGVEPARPNIVFILVDDLRWDALGCTGHPFAKTPHVDRLAREGAAFSNAFVTLPLCSPSRASFLTGQYAHTHGVTDNSNHDELSHKLVTWPRLLHDKGYTTAYVGKLHMGNDDSPRPGFDRWVSFKGQGAYVDPVINVDGKVEKVTGGYMTDVLDKHAVEFVKRKHDRPFALYLAHKAVHGPFTPAERHGELYVEDKVVRPPSFSDRLEGKPALTRNMTPPPETVPPMAAANHERIQRQQLRCLASIDEGVGNILKALEESKQLDQTLIVFTSDNGYFWGEHRLGDKRAAYEESIRIPLLMRYPRLIKAGSKIDSLVLNVDVAPTVLHLAGVDVPAAMQGKLVLPLFEGQTEGWRTAIMTEYFQEKPFPRVPTWQSVRTDRWKYIHFPDLKGADELYDLKADRHELKNLVDDQASQATLKDLKAELDKQKKGTGVK